MKNKSAIALSCLALAIMALGCAPKIFWASYHRDFKAIDSLLAAGADINGKYLGTTLLSSAALEGDVVLVKMLLERGADPSVRSTADPVRPRTPRQCAEDRGHKEVAQLLLEAEERKFGLSAPAAVPRNAPNPLPPDARQTTLSVMDLNVTSGLGPNEMMMLTDKLLNEFVANGYYKVVDRSNRDEILKEQGFQQSGACDQGACLVEAGQLLGVQKMVGGTIGKLGSVYAVELRVMDVKTGEIDQGFSREYRGDVATLLGAMREAAAVFSGIQTNKARPKGGW